ncbi:MAG: 4Fe-4S dicluster domain-containing protein, partial [Dehalococcoidia bacterium]|nr:4Fe-4S dicluster domain-containing protein [Dehalococcoidia bacterium]
GEGLVTCLPLVCQQCTEPACVKACPTEALSRNGGGILALEESMCSGCGDCVEACPAGCIFMDEKRTLPISCDLCGGEPQCVELCHSGCLSKAGNGLDVWQGVDSMVSLLDDLSLWDCLPGKGGR